MTIASAQISHDLAYQCLTSMPFDSGRAVIFLTQARKILEFQSTIDILKRKESSKAQSGVVKLTLLQRAPVGLYHAINRSPRRNRFDFGQGQKQWLFQPI